MAGNAIPNDSNSRVTLARVDERVKSVQGDLVDLKSTFRTEIGELKSEFKSFCQTEADERRRLEGQVNENREKIARQDERLKIVGGLNAVFTAVATGLSAVFGPRS